MTFWKKLFSKQKAGEFAKSDSGFVSFFEGLDPKTIDGGSYTLAELYSKSPIFHAVVNHTISEICNYPLLVYQGESEIKNHWLYRLFENPNQTSDTFLDIRRRFWLYYFIFGRSYIYSPPSQFSASAGVHTSMWVKPAYMVSPFIKSGKIIYYCGSNQSQFREPVFTEATEKEMLAMVALNPYDEVKGVSILQSIDRYCELDYEVANWNTDATRSAQRIPGVLKMKAFPPDQATRDAIRKDFKKTFSGNPGELMLLFGDMDFQALLSPKLDADFVESVKLIIRMICLAMGYPSRLIYPDTGATLSNADIEKEKAHWHTSVLSNYAKQEAQAYSRFFFPDGGLVVKPNYSAATGYQVAVAETLQRLSSLIKDGLMTINEVRSIAGFPPVAEKNADAILVDPNKVPLSEVGLLMSPVEPESDPDLVDLENE